MTSGQAGAQHTAPLPGNFGKESDGMFDCFRGERDGLRVRVAYGGSELSDELILLFCPLEQDGLSKHGG
jgi:hypothetical protein